MRAIKPSATAAVTGLALAMLLGCGGDAASTSPGTTVPSTSAAAVQPDASSFGGGSKTKCPPSFTGADESQTCTLAFNRVGFTKCPGPHPGGSDVMATGISCDQAADLLIPLGSGFVTHFGHKDVDIHRPWLASGRFTDPKPVKPVGWTCVSRYDPTLPVGVQHVCWDEAGAVLLFTFS